MTRTLIKFNEVASAEACAEGPDQTAGEGGAQGTEDVELRPTDRPF